ncbi:hypothetical protein CG51_18595 [Haematobacter missouriensis]|uniref:Uncharacterized protein n=1 Tax=Haematobacter missouriensis TaxID=366616 RepID=A0A212AJ13_9RHOB|nr:hypothetical protein [Haematobacter missouriensis]KFI24210.1 hypothetical protein CG51_18595 [Haematobacter missouriensis]OWJ74343.1 hypothetical protein CDV53_13865 [Haematobacter missouriensis]OWJ81469.1 hypothetical protein CDV52_18065 [Haematobacter missouriensis]
MTAATLEEPTRRALLNMAIAAPVAGMIHMGLNSGGTGSMSAAGLGPEETEVMQWFRRWLNVTARMHALPAGSPAFDGLLDEQTGIEDSLLAIPAENARDFVAKVYAYTNRGEVGLPNHNEIAELWAEARALIG